MVNNTAHSRYDNILGVMPEVAATPGSVASFDDGAENIPVEKLKIAIKLMQSGSGDPSPDNVRPITGWTGAKVMRTGKNLLVVNEHTLAKPSFYNGTWDGTTKVDSNSMQVTRSGSQGGFGGVCIENLKKGTYTFSCTLPITTGSKPFFYGYKPKGGNYSGQITGARFDPGTTKGIRILTFNEDVDCLFLKVTAYTEDIPIIVSNMQFEMASEATDFEPYIGETYDITFQSEAGTVYGGTLEINEDGSGVLTVTKVGYDGGNINWSKAASGYEYGTFFVRNDNFAFISQLQKNVISSNYKSVSHNGATQTGDNYVWIRNSGGNRYLYVKDTSKATMTVEEFQSAMSGVIFVADLLGSALRKFDITAGGITTLLGSNNIWADAGDISELTYRADVPLTIEKLKKAIVSLGGTV